MAMEKNLLERLKEGPVLCAEGYLFELERRGFLQAGAFVPEVVLDNPEVVEQLHREFLYAGSDVIEALTYYAHREKLAIVGKEDKLEEINRKALQIAKRVADEGNAYMAGNICNTNIFDPENAESHKKVRTIYEEQVQWAKEEGADFIIAETIAFYGEAKIALEVIQEAKMISVVTLAPHRTGDLRDGMNVVEACVKLSEAGADVVGLNCSWGPETMLPALKEIREKVSGPIAALPVPYRTNETQTSFQNLKDVDGKRAFPSGLDPFTCTRFEMGDFTKKAREIGVEYVGICCGAGPHHVRSMAEALGKKPQATRYSPDLSKHYSLGSHERLLKHNQKYQNDL